MSDFFMLKTDKVQKFIELRDDTLIKWSISPIYYEDICENCLLYEVDESVGEIAYQEVLETCPLCVNGSKLNYNEDYAPMSEDALKEYLADVYKRQSNPVLATPLAFVVIVDTTVDPFNISNCVPLFLTI